MTLYADASGHITGYFTIPDGIAAGTKRVQAYGAAGSYAETTFTGRGTITLRELRHTATAAIDPIAQTFALDDDAMCCGVDLKFSNAGTSDALIQIRETDNGVPTGDVLAQTIVPQASILIDENTWTRVTWPAVLLQNGVEYAITALCNDATMAMRHAELGAYSSHANKWITEQPYAVGVMLSSSNGRTWSPDQYKDLAFRLLGPTYSDAGYVREIPLTPVDVVDADYLQVLASIIRPVTGTDVVFELTVPTTPTPTVYQVTEGQPLLLPQTVTGQVTWKAILSGALHASPWMLRTVQLAAGTSRANGTYISRAFPANSDGCVVSVTLTATLPSPSTLTIYAQNGESDGDPTWSAALTLNGSPKAVGGGYYERNYQLASLTGVTSTRLKIVITGSAQARPEIRDLQCLVKDA